MPIDPADPIYMLRQQLAREITRALGGADSQFVIAPYYGIRQVRMSELSRGVEVGDAHRAWVEAMRRRRLIPRLE
jgi:hypothetical protein